VEEAVKRACGGCETLVIDLGEITFIDSSGVRALLGAVSACAEAYCWLELIPPRHDAPARALRALGIEHLLPWRLEGDDLPAA
jgi:anti-anti-sigma factor